MVELVIMDYLRSEIAKLEKIVAKKTIRTPSTATSTATVNRQRPGVGCFLESRRRVSLTRRLPLLHRRRSVREDCEVLIGVCRQAEEARRAYHQSTHRNDLPGVRLPRDICWKRGVQIGSWRKSSVFANEIDRCYRGERTAEARSAGTLVPPGGRDQVAIRVPATTPRAVLKNGSIREIAPRTVGTP